MSKHDTHYITRHYLSLRQHLHFNLNFNMNFNDMKYFTLETVWRVTTVEPGLQVSKLFT